MGAQGDRPLLERDLDPDPFRQLARWLEDAAASEPGDRSVSMVLATATTDGVPSVRWVLLRGFDERGLVFYTNRESRKGRELHGNPRGAAAFHWASLGRQLRAEGTVMPLPRSESARYFAGRPRAHQLAAWASPQGRTLRDRGDLEGRCREVEARFEGREVPLPPFWGGYRLTPVAIEFWQHRRNRLHDRVHYLREEGTWRMERLSP